MIDIKEKKFQELLELERYQNLHILVIVLFKK
jgi:hypothetical protein